MSEPLAVAESNIGQIEAVSPSDEDLMLRYQADDEEAATELIQRYSGPLKSYLRRLVGERVAEDLVQTTFLRVHEHRATYDPASPLHAWIYSIATHVAIDWMRRASRRKTISLEGRGDVDSGSLVEFLKGHVLTACVSAEIEESREDVQQAIDRLPPHLRSATTLVDLQGLSYADASRVLHVPVGTVKSRVYHARQQLRRDLEGEAD